VRGTVPLSGVRLNRELHVELQVTKGKKESTKNFRFQIAAGDSFQTGQTAKALQGYRVQSLPQGTPAAGVLVTGKHSSYSV